MTLKLYDYPLSGSCHKVRMLLSMLDVPHDKVPVDYYPGKAHRSPAFLKLNPLGQLPVIDDDGYVLRDAQAILVYLAARHDAGGRWHPHDAATQGRVAMWLAFAGNELMAASAARLHDMLGYREIDIEAARAGAHRALAVLDEHLAEQGFEGRQWLAADHPTIADIACFPYAALSTDGGVTREAYHHVNRWLYRVKALPGFVTMPGILAR